MIFRYSLRPKSIMISAIRSSAAMADPVYTAMRKGVMAEGRGMEKSRRSRSKNPARSGIKRSRKIKWRKGNLFFSIAVFLMEVI